MKSGGGLLFTAWLLLMAWCLFSNRVSTATVVGNSSLQMVTCKYLIFCSLDKYKLLVPPSSLCVCAETANRIEVNFGGDARGLINFRPRSAELPPLLSHGCPIIGWAAPMHFYTNCSDWAQIWWENPDGLPMPVRSPQSWPKRTSMLVPISPKRGIFSMGNANSRNQEKGGGFYF